MKILLIIGITYGLSSVITHGKILDRLRCYIAKKSRFFYELLTCMQCTGYWCGVFVSLILGCEFQSFLFGFLTSGINEFLDIIIKKLEQ